MLLNINFGDDVFSWDDHLCANAQCIGHRDIFKIEKVSHVTQSQLNHVTCKYAILKSLKQILS